MNFSDLVLRDARLSNYRVIGVLVKQRELRSNSDRVISEREIDIYESRKPFRYNVTLNTIFFESQNP